MLLLSLPLLSTLSSLWLVAPDVVELKDGSRLVGEIRVRKEKEPPNRDTEVREIIELQTAVGPLHFDPSEVATMERRAALLARFRLANRAADGRPHALISLAGWSLDHGLFAEAFDCVDRATAAAADPDALTATTTRLRAEALLDGAGPFCPPDADGREKLLARVGGSSGARAAFAHDLLLREEPQRLASWLLERLESVDVATRCGAADLLGAQCATGGHEALLSKLVRSSLVDSDERVRTHALDAAVRSHHPQLVLPYLTAIETDDPAFRARAYPALAAIQDRRAVPALIGMLEPRVAAGAGGSSLPHAHIFVGEQRAYVRDFDVEIAQGAVIAKPVIGVLQQGLLLDVAVAGVTIIHFDERRAVLGALKGLTNQELGTDPAAWRSWLRTHGGELPAR